MAFSQYAAVCFGFTTGPSAYFVPFLPSASFSEVVERIKLPGRSDVGAVRLRLVGLKNAAPQDVASAKVKTAAGSAYHAAVVLDLDYVVLMPRKHGHGHRRD